MALRVQAPSRSRSLCHGALFRFVCSLASINHVLSHPLFRVPTPLLFPSSSSSSHFSTPPPFPPISSRCRALVAPEMGSSGEETAERTARRLDDASKMNLEKMWFSVCDFLALFFEEEGLMSWVKLKCWLFESIGYGRWRYGKRSEKWWRLLYVDIAQCNNVDFKGWCNKICLRKRGYFESVKMWFHLVNFGIMYDEIFHLMDKLFLSTFNQERAWQAPLCHLLFTISSVLLNRTLFFPRKINYSFLLSINDISFIYFCKNKNTIWYYILEKSAFALLCILQECIHFTIKLIILLFRLNIRKWIIIKR